MSCKNNIRDGNETDIDCGAAGNGGCERPCAVGMHCLRAEDCVSGICGRDSKCVAGNVTKMCSNKIVDMAPPAQTRPLKGSKKDDKKSSFKRKFDKKTEMYVFFCRLTIIEERTC